MVSAVAPGALSTSFIRAPLDWFTTLRLMGDFPQLEQNQTIQELLLDLPHFSPKEFDQFLSEHLENLVSLTHIELSLFEKLAETLSDLYLKKCQATYWDNLSEKELPLHFQNLKQSLLYKMIALKYSPTSELKSAHGPLFFFIRNRILPRRENEWLKTIEKSCLDDEKEQNYLSVLNEIDCLIPFCSTPSDQQVIEKLYKIVQDSFEKNNKNTKTALKSVDQKIFNKPPFQNSASSISTHRSNLQTYRSSFPDNPKARFQSFRDLFFNPLFQNTLNILGEPPCGYDFRAKGSIGRHDMTSSSDLEYLLLIEDDQFKSYFYDLIYLIELQIITLGETSAKQAGAIPHFYGVVDHEQFHLDLGDFAQNIGTPSALADHQKYLELDPNVEGGFDPASGQNMALKTSRLHTNLSGSNLFTDYTEAIKRYLNRERALGLLRSRYADYKKSWIAPPDLQPQINIKKDLMALINYVIADLAIAYQLSEPFTPDLIQHLEEKNGLEPTTAKLLKKTVTYITEIRQKYQHVPYVSFYGLHVLTTQEQKQVSDIYSYVLRPLYSLIQKILDKSLIEPSIDLVTESLYLELGKETSQFKPFLEFFQSLDLPYELHEKLFKIIPENERKAYYSFLNLPSDQMQSLSLIPTSAGSRLAFQMAEDRVTTLLSQLTSPTPVDYHFQVQVTTPTGPSYLQPSAIQALVGTDGHILRMYKGTHPVSATGGLHFKQKATHPLMEYAIHNLFFRIAGPLTPATQLIRFDVQLKAGTKTYPVLVSETFPGEPFKNTWSTLSPTPEAWKSWSQLILCSLLTRPGDGLPSNYLTSSKGVTSIDNDISFVEPVQTEYMMPKINFCSALFCLFPDRPLDPDVLKTFATLHVDAILNAWIEDVIRKEQEYLALFSEKELETLYTEDKNNQFKASILFKEGTLATLNLQFFRLQNFITAQLEKNTPITSQTLLKELINLRESPNIENGAGVLVSRAYQKAHTLPTLDARLKQITSRQAETSLTSLQSDFAALGKVPTWEELHNRQEYAPSKAREELFSTLLKRSTSYISDGLVKGNRILKASFKEITRDGIPDLERQTLVLEALQYFALTGPKKLQVIVLQDCSTLTLKTLQPFLYEELEVLDITGSENITSLNVPGVFSSTPLYMPELKELHLSRCSKIQKVELTAPKLEKFIAVRNSTLSKLTINAPNCRHVEVQYCSSIPINELRTLLIDKLEVLKISGYKYLNAVLAPKYGEAPVLKLPELKELHCNKSETLTRIELYAPQLQVLQANDNPSLETIDIEGTKLLPSVSFKNSPLVKWFLSFEPFGKELWAKYFGDVGEEPPLPADIQSILEAPCPYWKGKKVRETHLLVLVPEKVNGDPLTIKSLGELIKKPLQGPGTEYSSFNLGGYPDPEAPKSHWALLTRDVIEGSRAKRYDEQKALIKAPYEAPTILDATVAILMEHVRTGKRLYSDDPNTITLCQQMWDDRMQLAVGRFSSDGLFVSCVWGGHDNIGVSALRKFP